MRLVEQDVMMPAHIFIRHHKQEEEITESRLMVSIMQIILKKHRF